MPYELRLFGTARCHATAVVRDHLDRLGVPYEYVDITADPQAAAWVKEQSAGQPRTPTLDISGNVFVKPSPHDVEEAVRSWGLLDHAHALPAAPEGGIAGEGLMERA